MEPQTKPRIDIKNFFINLGAIVALYASVGSLIDLLFTIINTAYPKITDGYSYFGSTSISWPVATLIIFFPIFILLMWLLERDYKVFPEKQYSGAHKLFTYITLFIAGLAVAIDLITVLYYFIDGQDLTAGFLLKVLVLLVVAGAVFAYYLSDALGKLTARSRNIYRVVALVIVLGSIIWGFAVLGSPHTQRLYKYDVEKVNELQNINNQITSFYANKVMLPETLSELQATNYYITLLDSQTQNPYEYKKTGKLTYEICAEFNKESQGATGPNIYLRPMGYESWTHPAGHYCFAETINPDMYSKPLPI